jgi:hypothetical protein
VSWRRSTAVSRPCGRRWEASGPSGVQFSGVTVLTRNDDGMIEHISISHRPLGALLEFSAEMHRRTQGKIEPGHFRAEG